MNNNAPSPPYDRWMQHALSYERHRIPGTPSPIPSPQPSPAMQPMLMPQSELKQGHAIRDERFSGRAGRAAAHRYPSPLASPPMQAAQAYPRSNSRAVTPARTPRSIDERSTSSPRSVCPSINFADITPPASPYARHVTPKSVSSSSRVKDNGFQRRGQSMAAASPPPTGGYAMPQFSRDKDGNYTYQELPAYDKRIIDYYMRYDSAPIGFSKGYLEHLKRFHPNRDRCPWATGKRPFPTHAQLQKDGGECVRHAFPTDCQYENTCVYPKGDDLCFMHFSNCGAFLDHMIEHYKEDAHLYKLWDEVLGGSGF